MQTVGQKIKILIRAVGMKQGDFASKVDYHPAHFSRMLNGGDISDKALEVIARTLGVSKELLLSNEPLEYGKLPEGLALINDPYPNENEINELKAREAQLIVENRRLAEDLLRERSINDDLRKVLVKIAGGGADQES